MYILTQVMRDSFINGLRQGYAKKLPKKLIKNCSDIAFGAKELYLSGTPFNNRGNHKQIRMKHKSALVRVLNPIVEKFYAYFNETPAPSTQHDFDKVHKELCELFIESFEAEGYTHTYGNAQKFCNVLFKYLSCYEDSEDFAEWFKYCHMAIDRYTYNGYRLPFYRNIVYRAIHGESAPELTSWSKLTNDDENDYEYDSIISDIVKYISDHPKTYNEYLNICSIFPIFTSISPLATEDDYELTPFEAEFFIWAIAKACASKDKNEKYIYEKDTIDRVKKRL